MYETISDLPLVCRINLPEPALKVYRAAFNRAWEAGQPHVLAQKAAWDAVREEFEREKETGRWVRRRSRGAAPASGAGTSAAEAAAPRERLSL